MKTYDELMADAADLIRKGGGAGPLGNLSTNQILEAALRVAMNSGADAATWAANTSEAKPRGRAASKAKAEEVATD